MNGWTFLTIFVIVIALTSDPVKSQVNCYLGVPNACSHLGEAQK